MKKAQGQKTPFVTITTAAGADAFVLHKMEGIEEISELFEFRTELYSMTTKNAKALAVNFATILQKDAAITVHFQNKTQRHFHGIVTDIMQGPTIAYASKATDKKHERTYFKITIRPKLWLLTRRENCRIFQNKTAMEIIKSILAEHQIKLEDQTSTAGKARREYCVQYNENDFAFISRLMEAEGIYYFFSHTATLHTLVLFDGSKPYKACTNATQIKSLQPSIPAYAALGIQELNIHQQIVSDAFTTKDFSFEQPNTNLKAKASGATKLAEVYHYPGDYKVQATGEAIASRRLDAIEVTKSALTGRSNVPFMMPGYFFKLMYAARKDKDNLDYVISKVVHHIETPDEAPALYAPMDPAALLEDKKQSSKEQEIYTNTFSCIPKTAKYRPPLKTEKPRIFGTQTAIVTGKVGEEIWTDKYGRVLVKFHWDLDPTKNENTSCWIRVMQHWTGKNWGMQFTPRIGQEVVVTFLNGDPDYPLITGCVYNGDNLPPYLPGEPTRSTIKTNSSKGGKGFNELRFEDKKDNEEVYVHAERDLTIDVLNGNRTTTLKAAKNKPVTDTLKIVKGHRIKTLTEGNETVTLTKGNRSVTLSEGNDSLTLAKGDETVKLSKGNRSVTLTDGNDTLTLNKGNRTVKIKGNQSHDISQNCTLKVGGNLTIEVTGNISMKGQAVSIKCTTFSLEATASSSMKSATLSIKANATAEIAAGATMMVKGEAQATFQSSAMVNIKGAILNAEGSAMATLKGAMATVQGSGIGALKGGIVMIG